jgi:hypothetical protein
MYQHDTIIENVYYWKVFWKNVTVDLVLVYKPIWKDFLDRIKIEVNEIFREYFIDIVWVVFMSSDEFQKRYRVSDRFVLSLLNWK